MPSTSLRSLVSLFVSFLFYASALSRRINGRHGIHRHHHARQIDETSYYTYAYTFGDEPTPVAETYTQYVTAGPVYNPNYNPNYSPDNNPDGNENGNQLASDFSNFLNSLSNLPNELTRFIQAIEQRFADFESVINNFVGNPTGGSSSVTYNTITIDHSSPYSLPPGLCRGWEGIPTPCPATSTTPSYSTSFQTIAPYPIANSTSGAFATGVPPPTATPTPYTFNAEAPDNVAVYYGQSPDTQKGGLSMLCSNNNVDIVILAFVSDFFGQNGYPTASFGPGCSGPNEAQAATAPGLPDCSELAIEIQQCQQIGKKVLVSVGGYIANSSFTSDTQARQFADTLWNLFGAGTGDDPALRPFGAGVTVDGFDIDNENHDSTGYPTLATELRGLFYQDSSKTYYLSAAPQCPAPDDSMGWYVTGEVDFVWVQFYNNPQCNLDSTGFQDSFEYWATFLRQHRIYMLGAGSRIYIGAGAFQGAGTGYVPGSALSSVISQARELNMPNLGGIMLWDGSEAMANVDPYGNNYIKYAKAALEL